jgi:DNA repair exonuclease SbcCD ATPase subunit
MGMKYIWIGNYLYPDLGTVQEYNDRIRLESRCVRSYPMPSDVRSIEELEAMGFYGLYKIEDDSEEPCPNCSFSHPIAPLFQNERKRIYDLETELNTLRKNNASKPEINAKIKEIDRAING